MKTTLLQDLIKLTIEKNNTLIKETLNKKQPNKGRIFEEYISELFNGNGFVAYVTKKSHDKGGDVIVYDPKDLDHPIFVIQAKNCAPVLGLIPCRNIKDRFKYDTYQKYGCNKGVIISLNGFCKPAKEQITDVQLESFEFIEKLIDNYKINNINGNCIIFDNIVNRLSENWRQNFSKTKKYYELDDWYKIYEELLNYNSIFGNTLVPKNYTNKKLYYWTINMRQANKHDLLEFGEDKLKKNFLNKIGFIWDVNEYNWNKKYNELLQFKKQFNTINVPQQYPYKVLGKWVNTQRNLKKTLIPDRELRLNKIGFVWDMNMKNWDMMFEKLIDYKSKYETCNISKNIGFKLGNWLKAQRILYKEEKLESYRLNKLKEIGIKFRTHEDDWDYMYDKLKKYETIFKDCLVKNNYDKKLYYWVLKQRKDYKKEKLIPYKLAKLQELNFTFDYNKLYFIKKYDELREYKDKYGNCLVSPNYDDKSLVYWVCNIRRLFFKNNLDEHKINQLNDIGFIWNVREYTFNNRIEELKTFKKEKGTFHVPFRYKSLGKWLFDIKKLYRNGKLKLQIIDAFRNLGLELD